MRRNLRIRRVHCDSIKIKNENIRQTAGTDSRECRTHAGHNILFESFARSLYQLIPRIVSIVVVPREKTGQVA